jgi:hypothetical protein
MSPNPILAEPPWHSWIGLFSLVLDVIILIGLGLLYYRMVVAPTQPWHRSDVVPPSRREGGSRRAGTADGG